MRGYIPVHPEYLGQCHTCSHAPHVQSHAQHTQSVTLLPAHLALCPLCPRPVALPALSSHKVHCPPCPSRPMCFPFLRPLPNRPAQPHASTEKTHGTLNRQKGSLTSTVKVMRMAHILPSEQVHCLSGYAQLPACAALCGAQAHHAHNILLLQTVAHQHIQHCEHMRAHPRAHTLTHTHIYTCARRALWPQDSAAIAMTAYLMSTILMTLALPMRCSATMLSPLVQ